MTAWSFSLGSEPATIATTLLESKGRTLLTMCALNFAGSASALKPGLAAADIMSSRFLPQSCASLRATSSCIHEAILSLGAGSLRRYERSPDQELRTTSQP